MWNIQNHSVIPESTQQGLFSHLVALSPPTDFFSLNNHDLISLVTYEANAVSFRAMFWWNSSNLATESWNLQTWQIYWLIITAMLLRYCLKMMIVPMKFWLSLWNQPQMISCFCCKTCISVWEATQNEKTGLGIVPTMTFCRFADSDWKTKLTTSCCSLSQKYVHIDIHTSYTGKLYMWTPPHKLAHKRTFMTHTLQRPAEKKKSLLITCLLGSSFPVSKKRFSFVLMD